jgi:hypothetical protein
MTLSGAGLALQIVGLLVLGIGLWKTWHEFAEGEHFRDPYVTRARALVRWLDYRLRRLIGRPRPINLEGRAASQFGMSSSGLGVVGWPPLPKTTRPALNELERRIDEVSNRVASVQTELGAETTNRDDADKALEARLTGEVGRLNVRTKRVAVGGIRWQATGLLLLAVGLVLSSVKP